ncbi:hypothetical protein C8R44DRAFT_195663 [Mycena epipterygia]|nr:hypothetical protein C8R44DRAFT_195663 [Mycena epipterygia]
MYTSPLAAPPTSAPMYGSQAQAQEGYSTYDARGEYAVVDKHAPYGVVDKHPQAQYVGDMEMEMEMDVPAMQYHPVSVQQYPATHQPHSQSHPAQQQQQQQQQQRYTPPPILAASLRRTSSSSYAARRVSYPQYVHGGQRYEGEYQDQDQEQEQEQEHTPTQELEGGYAQQHGEYAAGHGGEYGEASYQTPEYQTSTPGSSYPPTPVDAPHDPAHLMQYHEKLRSLTPPSCAAPFDFDSAPADADADAGPAVPAPSAAGAVPPRG